MRTARGKIGLSTLALVFLVSASGLPQALPRRQDEVARKLRESDRRLLYLVKRAMAEPGALPYDWRGRADLLGSDPNRIFEFVRKEIAFEPYGGLQRGPAGVLVSGRGNSADQAFLLQRMLNASGQDARLVSGTLDDATANRLLDAAAKALSGGEPGGRSGPFGLEPADPAKAEEMCRKLGVSPDRLLAQSRQRQEALDADWADVLNLTARETRLLEGAVTAADFRVPARDLRSDLLAAVRDHVWVQWRPAPDRNWIDLDPALPELQAGQKAVEGDGRPVDPDALAPRIALELTLERKVGQKREPVRLLIHQVPLHRLLLDPLHFSIHPSGSFRTPGKDDPPEKAYAQLASAREFQAVLKVGEETAGSKVFDLDGQVFDIQSDGRMKAASALQRGLGKAFGGLGRALGRGAKPVLSGLWLDVRILHRKKIVWEQRRTILGEASKEDRIPILEWEFFSQTHELTSDFADALGLAYRVKNDRAYQQALDWVASEKPEPRDLEGVRFRTYPFDLLSMCLARQAFIRETEHRLGRRLWLHFDRPNLLIKSKRLRLHEEDKSFCFCTGIDIVENGGVILGGGGPFQADRAATLALGAFDTVLEEHKLRTWNEAEAVRGTVGYFERARAQDLEIGFVAARDRAGLDAAGMPASDAAWILRHAGEGDAVLAAARTDKPGSVAWWSYDPATGRVLGRISGGRGGAEASTTVPQAVIEYTTVLRLISIGLCLWSIGSTAWRGEYEKMIGHIFICAIFAGIGGVSVWWIKEAGKNANLVASIFFFFGVSLNQLLKWAG